MTRRLVGVFFSMMLGTGALCAAPGRVTVLDLGVESGVTNGFGCASAPQAFVRALGEAYDVRVVPYAQVRTEGAFDAARTDLLVIPSGALFPNDCAKDLVAFLRRGGLLLTTGGYAFDEPMQFERGGWVLPEYKPLPAPVCENSQPLPPAAAWQSHADPESKVVISGETGPEGRPAIRIHTPRLRRYSLGNCPLAKATADARREALAFRVKGDASLKVVRVELNEADGTRWWANVPVSEAWRDCALTWTDFTFHGDSPTKKTRGGPSDRIDFSKVVRLVVGICHIGNVPGGPQTAWFSDLRFGADPLAAQRTRPEPRAHINHRHYGPGWRDKPRSDQLGVFSPAYSFKDVVEIVNDEQSADLFARTELKGCFSGWDASAMLTPEIHAHAKNRAVLRPVLACRAADGTLKGRAASLVFHYDSVFKGSAWALFGVDSQDLFATPANDRLLCEMVDALFRRVFLARTRPKFDCYRMGETMEFSTELMDFSKRAMRGEVRFVVSDEFGRTVYETRVPAEARPSQSVKVDFSWEVPQADVDLYRIVAEFISENRVVDREENAIAVWNEKTIAQGPRLGVDGTYFTIDGQKRFWIGAQMFLARQTSYTSASALRFYRDFESMRKAGMRISRNFFGWDPVKDLDRPESERLLRLMDACIVLSQKFGIVTYFNPVCGNEIPRTPEEVAREAKSVEMFARRYRAVPGFLMDVRNEARLDGRTRDPGPNPMNEQKLADAFVDWARAVADAAERGRTGIPVATGWSQGWGGGSAYKDPPTAALPFSFSDCHYYGGNENHLSEIKKIDQRILGRPAVMGECGVAFNPERVKYSDSFATEEEAARRYRCQAVQTLGAGYAFMCNYGWTDLIEGNLTFALCHWDRNPRDILSVYSNLARKLGAFDIRERAPDVALVLSKTRHQRGSEKSRTLAAYRNAVNALSWWGANYSVLPEESDLVPATGVKVVLSTDDLVAAGFGDVLDDLRGVRAFVGARLQKAGAFVTRRPEDSEALGTYRIDGVGETIWAFWNGSRTAITTERDGHRIVVESERGGLLRIGTDGRLISSQAL